MFQKAWLVWGRISYQPTAEQEASFKPDFFSEMASIAAFDKTGRSETIDKTTNKVN